jgi:hypothetical protein
MHAPYTGGMRTVRPVPWLTSGAIVSLGDAFELVGLLAAPLGAGFRQT